MRILAVAGLLVLALSGTALAQQGYTYQPSGLEFTSTVPVERGETVRGLILLETGLTTLGDVLVEDLYADDLFVYWVGYFNGAYYYYDLYNAYWKPGPVTYRRAMLDFQGETVEGWVRQFGLWTDYNHFFGQDGVLYQRINIERNRRRDTSRRRQVVYTYFVNMETGERSDALGRSYIVIGDEEVAREVVEEQMEQAEEALATIVEENPAFPMWQLEAFAPPEEIAVPADDLEANQVTLLDLIEEEIGPLNVEEAEAGAGAAAE